MSVNCIPPSEVVVEQELALNLSRSTVQVTSCSLCAVEVLVHCLCAVHDEGSVLHQVEEDPTSAIGLAAESPLHQDSLATAPHFDKMRKGAPQYRE